MKRREFFKAKSGVLIGNGFAYLGIASVLFILGTTLYQLVIICVIWFVPLLSYMLYEADKLSRYYTILDEQLEMFKDNLYLIEVLELPNFLEGQLNYQSLQKLARHLNRQTKQYQNREQEYTEYIEQWIHEIKTPLASALLIIENNETEATVRIREQLGRIDDYIEQVLYFTKGSDVNTDYFIQEIELESVIFPVIKKYAKDFIYKEITLETQDLAITILSDRKWITFLINQIIGNAIKYSLNETSKIQIRAVEHAQMVELSISDTGIGIAPQDLGRVFEKGFTGANGRNFVKATGIGLYLCKTLCNRLGLGLTIDSQLHVGTTVRIQFPKAEQLNRNF